MKRIVLAGGGHGHINILKMLAQNPISDYKIILITNFAKQYYSGMLPGFIEGIYTEEEISFDVEDLCKKAGVSYVQANITKIDANKKLIETKKGNFEYDYLSMNLGLESKKKIHISKDNASYVKPIASLVEFSNKIEKNYKNKNLVIAGAGVSGIEIAFAFKERYPALNIKILARSNTFLKSFNSSFKEKIKSLLNKRTINLVLDSEVLNVENNKIIVTNGQEPYDYLILANGYKGVSIDFHGFEMTDENYILVDDTLTAEKDTLAMGDMISFKRYGTLVKAGVFAIHQAPILYNNLMYTIGKEKELKTYKPQNKYLQIINIGNKRAIMSYGSFSMYGKVAWLIKDYIDRKYMGKNR